MWLALGYCHSADEGHAIWLKATDFQNVSSLKWEIYTYTMSQGTRSNLHCQISKRWSMSTETTETILRQNMLWFHHRGADKADLITLPTSSRPQNVSNDSRLKFESDWSCYEKGFCFHGLLNCHLGTQLSTQLFVIYDKSFIIKTGMDTSLLCPIHDWWPCWSYLFENYWVWVFMTIDFEIFCTKLT